MLRLRIIHNTRRSCFRMRSVSVPEVPPRTFLRARFMHVRAALCAARMRMRVRRFATFYTEASIFREDGAMEIMKE